MRVIVLATTIAVATAGLVSAPSAVAPAAAAADTVVANYQMNESSGTTVMNDSSGNGLNGVVNPAGVTSGQTYNGATGYVWSKRSPTAPPPEPQRVITVPDNAKLEPGAEDFTLEFRYRNQEAYGNIIQKGQSTQVGGQWKVQNPGGQPSCLFKGSTGSQIAAQSTVVIRDNQWHVLECRYSVLDAATSRVDLYIDGVFNSRKQGFVGVINNGANMVIGGKDRCDQVATTCDYFTGSIDYVKIYKPGATGPTNQPPDAVLPAPSCALLDCAFTSTGSTDSDGRIASYAWTFGDGATSTDPNPRHVFPRAGSYSVRLTVTDDDGATDTATRVVAVVAAVVPSRPREAEASAGDSSATVTWLKPSEAGTSPVTGYTVTSSPDSHTCTTSGLTCAVQGLQNGKPYTFTVVATSAAGTSLPSIATDPVTPVGLPLAPPGFQVTAGLRKVSVSWDPADGNGSAVTGYVLTTSPGGASQTLPATAEGVVLTGLRAGDPFRVSVSARSAQGTGATATASAVPFARPYKIARLRVEVRRKAALVIWRAPESSGSRIMTYTVMASNGKKVSVGSDKRRVRVAGLKTGHKLAFRVVATNELGAGPWSRWTRKVTIR